MIAAAGLLTNQLHAQPPASDGPPHTLLEPPPDDFDAAPPTWPDGRPAPSNELVLPYGQTAPPDGYPGPPLNEPVYDQPWSLRSLYPANWFPPLVTTFGLRHSSTDGRNVGLGGPLVGTSWLNRPIYGGGELGSIWIMRRVEDSVSRDTDVIGGFYFGWDWDFYWGSELRFDWATPELINSDAPDANRADSLFIWNYNLMYYPWGDSRFRPYWRWGIGGAHFDYPTDDGNRDDQTLLTLPIGLGLKFPIDRWMAARAEFTDLISVGAGGLPTMNNLTLTLGFELRYGVRPQSYWPWNPSRHIW